MHVKLFNELSALADEDIYTIDRCTVFDPNALSKYITCRPTLPRYITCTEPRSTAIPRTAMCSFREFQDGWENTVQ